MDSGRGKATMNVEGDRLSNLPDDLIHKVLSFIDIKHVVQTSALSSRWRCIWTSMPYLNISSKHFSDYVSDWHKFSEFVTHVLSRRNNQIEVFSLNLKLTCDEFVSRVYLDEIFDYAFSHNIQQLTVSCLFPQKIKIPLDFFRSQSLKHLTLTGPIEYFTGYSSTLALTWELPALTTLHLDHVKFSDEDTCLFSKCTNLKSLTLKHFKMKNSSKYGLSICHPQISSITLKNGQPGIKVVNVVAPQLQSLCIINCFGRHQISAPDLVTLLYKGHQPLQFSNDDLCCLEKVDFCIYYPHLYGAHKVVGLLQRLHNVRCLARAGSRFLEALSEINFGGLVH